MIAANYHTHTSRCGHAVGTDEEYVLAAIEAGYKILGFSDHAPYRHYPNKFVHMNWGQLDDYIESVSALKEKYKDQIEIHLGLESEYYTKTLEEKKYLRSRVEYLILGQHFAKPSGMGTYFARNSDKQIRQYGDMVVEGLDTGMFMYLAHPDVYMFKQTEFTDACAETAHRIAAKAAETNTPLEINVHRVSSGKNPFGNQMEYYYPHKDFWRIAAQYPVKVLIGIDAHDPKQLLDKQSIIDGMQELEDLHLDYIQDNILL